MTHHRVCETGKQFGRVSATLQARGRVLLEAQGLLQLNLPTIRDDMCPTCACRPGKVPNGCLQTQLDFLKAVVEAVPFLCHSPNDGRMCAGYVAARAAHVALPLPAELVAHLKAYKFSPPDQPEPPL